MSTATGSKPAAERDFAAIGRPRRPLCAAAGRIAVADRRLPAVLAGAVVLLVLAAVALSATPQEGVDLRNLEIVVPGAPDPAQQPGESAAEATGHWAALRQWADSPQGRLLLTASLIGSAMLVVLLGRAWRRLPIEDRAMILLCATLGRGRGLRSRVASLAGTQGPGGRTITPVAMMLAPRAFDAALANATHAQRAYGQPLRHAVHGFRKA
ncbi:MAG: hypothetical protein KatS3mg103_0714 [Phycisphaerales bacterium]|nr:MAG: hypothetical protein KatS3mg103_0714 [Phycisphaerales bacterium]